MLEMNRILLQISIKKDTCFYAEDAYYYYDINVDRILLHKESENEYFIRYRHSNKMDIVPLQLKIIFFYYDIKDYDGSEDTMYIENSDERFFQKMKEIWNKIIELIGINYAPDFVKYTLDDEKYIWQMYLKIQILLKAIVIKMKS